MRMSDGESIDGICLSSKRFTGVSGQLLTKNTIFDADYSIGAKNPLFYENSALITEILSETSIDYNL